MPILVSGQEPDESLATPADIAALGAAVDEATATALLAQASARFRSEAQHEITARDYEQTFRCAQGYLRLTRVPVARIIQVAQVEPDGSTGLPVVGWTFDGVDRVDVRGTDGLVFNAPEPLRYRGTRGPLTVRVAWRAGFEVIPEAVRWAVAAMASRAAQSPAAGIISERIGDYSISTGSYTASGALSMTADEKAVAHKFRSRRSSMSVEAV